MIKLIKYIIIVFIATGIVLSLIFGIEYSCQGKEVFPTYFGSPFIFKKTSLGSSMEFFYSVSGLIVNIIIWSILITWINRLALRLIQKSRLKFIFYSIYKTVVVLLLLFSILNIIIDSSLMGNGFQKGLNYWYIDLDKEAEDWEMNCDGKWISLKSK
ncbi:hypothetical protein BST91_05675 [Nonlabens tegetincola]|nr:hypothetical protein BST91_05675 [Nonlabens tegetincola]